MREAFLTFNPGSSSLKLGLFTVDGGQPRALAQAAIDLDKEPLVLQITQDQKRFDVVLEKGSASLEPLIEEIVGELTQHFSLGKLIGAAHRVVHGGDQFSGPVVIDADTLAGIAALAPLAPLHQAKSIQIITAARRLWPDLPQAASFDTAFHRTQSDVVRRFALPRALFDEGVKRYGFHGLSYQSIAGQLRRMYPDLHAGRVVVAHLGSGASLCGLEHGVSRDTSMGFSTLDGVPMATRPGAVDPGVLLYLLKERGMTLDALEDMLYHQSGLLGASGISSDVRALVASHATQAKETIALQTLRIAREIAAIATTLGGLNAVVFTAGIGEHQPDVRAAVCAHLAWLGVQLDKLANSNHATRIDTPSSKVALLVLHTDEEQVMVEEALPLLSRPKAR